MSEFFLPLIVRVPLACSHLGLPAMEARDSRRPWPADVIDLLVRSGTLCLDVKNPGWDDARGYLLDQAEMTLFFPVAKKYLAGADMSDFAVLIWGQPRAVARGALHPATSEQDTATQLRLAEAGGLERDKARYMVLDQRKQKARRTSHKLILRDVTVLGE